MNTATPMSVSVTTVPPSASTRSSRRRWSSAPDRDVRQARLVHRPLAPRPAAPGVGEQLEHEAALAQVDGPQAEGRIELEQAAGDVVGWRDLTLVFEAQQLLVEAPGSVDVVHAWDVVHDAAGHVHASLTAGTVQKADVSVRIGPVRIG